MTFMDFSKAVDIIHDQARRRIGPSGANMKQNRPLTETLIALAWTASKLTAAIMMTIRLPFTAGLPMNTA